MAAVQIFLDSKRARQFDGRHPWVMQHAVVEPTVPVSPGETVELMNINGSWIGRGIYNPKSRIRIRLYQWRPDETLDDAWLRTQLDRALQLRQSLVQQRGPLDAYRLVNSEGDGLGGLIIDRFQDYYVVQFNALSMFHWKDVVLQWLNEHLQPAGIRVVVDDRVAKQEGLEPMSDWTEGRPPESALTIQEQDVKLTINLQEAQKTGYYLDQRANREQTARWINPGRMLDVCSYHGGFALAALKNGAATEAVCIDSSAKALGYAETNAQQNEVALDLRQGDCFDLLKELHGKETFESVVLDPPKMASNRNQLTSALRAYHRLNLSAVQLLNPGGTLVSCSCSGRVLKDDLVGILSSVSKRTRRRIQILEARGADADHPYDVNCPETDYLKCLICRVE